MSDFELVSSSDNISIVHPVPDQWETLRDLKIESIKQDRIAFADPIPELQKYNERSKEEWQAILSGKMSGNREGESIVLLAKEANKYVGMITAIIPQNSQKATIQHTFVDQFHRQKGIGEHLLTTLISQLKQKHNLTSIELDVVVTQEPAIALYKKLGFIVKGYTKEKAIRGKEEYERYVMELPL